MKHKNTLDTTLAVWHQRFGWTTLLGWLVFGTLLEAAHGFKLADYLLNPVRREFWQLAHFHGATLALVNLVYMRWAETPGLSPNLRRWASRALLAGSALMPLGFFLGGLWHFDGDPGWGIFLSPPGAVFIIFTLGVQTWAAWRTPPP